LKVLTVKPLIEREEALKKLKKLRKGTLKAVELLYLPFWCFIFDLKAKIKKEVRNLRAAVVIDGVLGEVALYDGELSDLEGNLSEVDEEKLLPVEINLDRKKIVEEANKELAKVVYRKLKFVSDMSLTSSKLIYFPFWIGYFHEKGLIQIDIVNAVSGETSNPWCIRAIIRGLVMKHLHKSP